MATSPVGFADGLADGFAHGLGCSKDQRSPSLRDVQSAPRSSGLANLGVTTHFVSALILSAQDRWRNRALQDEVTMLRAQLEESNKSKR